MGRYQIWNKTDDIFTPIGEQISAEDWIARYPWAGIPGVKMIISAGVINGGVAMEFNAAKEQYTRMGATITNDMTDAEVLQAIEDFEDTPPSTTPSAEERIAAALEFQAISSLPDVE